MNNTHIDAQDLKEQLDCRRVVEDVLGPPESIGENYVWPCPFHTEQSVGGFHVWRDGWKCFSCGEHGSVIDFIMLIDDLSFKDAVTRLNGGKPLPMPDPQEAARRATERAEKVTKELERKIEEAQRALEELRQAQSWLKYYDALDEHARKLWRNRGIPDHYQDMWQLGYREDYSLWKIEDGNWIAWWKTPTLSIPIWGHGWQVNNLKYRLLREPPEGGKYRQERSGIPAAPFICYPDTNKGPLFITEGEIKAMVTFATINAETIQVAGLPSKTPQPAIYDHFSNYEPIYLCLDPDAYESEKPETPSAFEKAIQALGAERTRVIWLPMKIDDAINAGMIGKNDLRRLLITARKMPR